MRQTDLVERVLAYDPAADEAVLNKAYVYAMTAHGKQFRASGDPYFAHPLEVAAILTDLKLDVPTIVTALLHDTIEDTLVTYEDVKDKFGEEIANLVDGVTKLSQLEVFSERTKQAENFRKLMLAITSDIRVLLVKLADRLHNMRTLGYIDKPDKRRRIAQETVDIYAPLAGRIGMQNMREELEDLAFAELDPEARNSIVTHFARLDMVGGDRVGRIADQIKRKLAEHDMEAWVYGRGKRPFSIWRKLQTKKLSFEQLSDIFGFRVIVGSTGDCYRALGIIHTSWQMVPERFKDFISTPKPNGYRSIHTTVIGPEKQRVEIQIRTQDMHDIAERGVAAHWRYREHVPDAGKDDSTTYGWLRDMVDLLERGDSAEEVLEHSRLAMYQDQVFCFTPKGSLISLPKGATPIDFAYAVHTDMGNSAVGAKVNGNHVALHTPLKNGDQVEIITTKDATPSPMWEQFVVTGRARAEIRRFLRHAQRDEHVRFGRKILEKTFADEKRELTDKAIEEVAKKLRLSKAEDVFADVGRGALRGHEVLQAVFPELKRSSKLAQEDGARRGEADLHSRSDPGHFLHAGPVLPSAAGRPDCRHPDAGRGAGDPHHRLRRTGQGAEHGRLAGCGLGRRRLRHGPVGGAHFRAGQECAGQPGDGDDRHRRQWRQHLQHEGHRPQSAVLRVHRGYRGARRGAFAEYSGRATRIRRGRIG